jgi:hypothetical protein
MHTHNKGFAPVITILLIAAGIAVLGGSFYYFHAQAPVTPPAAALNPTSTPPAVPIVTPTSTGISTSTGTGFLLSPSSGPVGTVVTIHGSGFAATGNTVTFNSMVGSSMKYLPSADGKTLTFTVPSSLGPNCNLKEACPQYIMMTGPRAYSVSVISGNGTQSVGTFTVTSRGGLLPLQ